ncbi:hypothetical protein ABZW10_32995 [Kitasatospora sp. NPDC004723]|uniref:hypothetical protein n=1 Tax=Kitasatospora sp. NPDC004723 TaxID=3154288 RepID=UPI0033BC63E1
MPATRVKPARRPSARPTAYDEQGRPAPATRRGRAVRSLGRWHHRNRRHLPPVYGAVLLSGLGEAFAAAPQGGTGALAFDAAAAGTVLAWRSWRRKKAWAGKAAAWLATNGILPTPPGRPVRRAELLRTAAATATAGGMLTVAAASGCGPWHAPMAGWWWLVWTPTVGLTWWWRRRIRRTEEEPVVAADAATVWAQRIGASGKALPKSVLCDVEPLEAEGAWRATVELDPGQQSAEDAIGATLKIAGAYGVPVSSVAIEAHPSANPSLAELRLYPVNPLIDVPVFPGMDIAFDPETGIARIGLHVDGTYALYQLYRPRHGAVHDSISGSTGSGKSTVFHTLWTIERHSGVCVSWGGDPQGGASFGFWQNYLDYFARSTDEILAMLRCAEAEMERRGKLIGASRWIDEDGDEQWGEIGFTPTPENPLLVVTIDEWDSVWEAYPEALEIAVRIATKGRKVGVKLRLAHHLCTLESLGSAKLRAPVMAGNIIVLRNTDRASGHVVRLPADPSDLPAVWPGVEGPAATTSGLGYIKSAGGERSATYRGWRPEPDRVATRWPKSATNVATLAPEAAEVMGEAYTEWRDRVDHFRRTGEELPVPGVTDLVEDDENEDGEGGGGRRKSKKKATASTPQQRTSAGPTGELAAMIKAEAGRAATGAKKLAIMQALAELGTATTGQIADRSGCSVGTVSTTLGREAKAGRVEDWGHGLWAPKSDATSDATTAA